jgi:hypothetical protein
MYLVTVVAAPQIIKHLSCYSSLGPWLQLGVNPWKEHIRNGKIVQY